MKSTNTSSSEGVTLKTLLCLNLQNHSLDCLVTQLLFRYVMHFRLDLIYFSFLFPNPPPQSSLGSPSVPYHPRWSPYRDVMPGYNQLAASSLLSQQYNTALGLGESCCHLHALPSPPRVQTLLPCLRLCPQSLVFMASQPEELPWWSRPSRRCHRSALARGGEAR